MQLTHDQLTEAAELAAECGLENHTAELTNVGTTFEGLAVFGWVK